MGFLRILLIVVLVIFIVRFLSRLLIGLVSAVRGGPSQDSAQSSPPQRYRDVKDAEFEDLNDKPKQ